LKGSATPVFSRHPASRVIGVIQDHTIQRMSDRGNADGG